MSTPIPSLIERLDSGEGPEIDFVFHGVRFRTMASLQAGAMMMLNEQSAVAAICKPDKGWKTYDIPEQWAQLAVSPELIAEILRSVPGRCIARLQRARPMGANRRLRKHTRLAGFSRSASYRNGAGHAQRLFAARATRSPRRAKARNLK